MTTPRDELLRKLAERIWQQYDEGPSIRQLEEMLAAFASELGAAVRADYEAVLANHARLVRQLDVAVFGAGAALQASLCDLVASIPQGARRREAAAREAAIEECEASATICNPCGDERWNAGYRAAQRTAAENIRKLRRAPPPAEAQEQRQGSSVESASRPVAPAREAAQPRAEKEEEERK